MAASASGTLCRSEKTYLGFNLVSPKSQPPTSKSPMSASLHIHCRSWRKEQSHWSRTTMLSRSSSQSRSWRKKMVSYHLIPIVIIIWSKIQAKLSRTQFEIGDCVNSQQERLCGKWIIWLCGDCGGQFVDQCLPISYRLYNHQADQATGGLGGLQTRSRQNRSISDVLQKIWIHCWQISI